MFPAESAPKRRQQLEQPPATGRQQVVPRQQLAPWPWQQTAPGRRHPPSAPGRVSWFPSC